MNLHGIPRMTADIDIILDLKKENLARFEKCAAEINYKMSIPVSFSDITDELKLKKLVQTKNLIALSFFNYDKNFLALDVLIDFPIPFEELWSGRIVRHEGNTSVNIVSVEHLIRLKEFSDRIQDKQDIFFLSKIKNEKGEGK